jgi:hypothetical protein
VQDLRPRKMGGKVWKMGSAGLDCVSCPKKKTNTANDEEEEY